MIADTGTNLAGSVDKQLALRLRDLEQHAARVLGVQEVDAGTAGAVFGFGVEQAHALAAQVLGERIDVVGAQAHLLDAGTFLFEEFGDCGVLVERRDELNHSFCAFDVFGADHGL